MLQRFRDLPDDAITKNIRGANVYGLDNDKIGTIDDVVFDDDSGDPGYAVIDSGGWLTSRKFLVPIEKLQSFRGSDDEFQLPTRREQLQTLPAFEDKYLEDESMFHTYRDRWSSSWSRPTGNELRHPRLVALEDRFRRPRDLASEDTYVTSSRPISNVVPMETPRRIDNERVTSINDAETASFNNVAVYGVFHDEEKTREAVNGLKHEGFSDSDLSVVFPDRGDTEKFAVENNTKAPEGATAGGVTGAITGGVLGWLAGVGMIAIPGIGPLLAAGPIVAALAGAGAVGAAGGIVGALVGMGVPEYEAKKYHDELKAGRILVAVQCSDVRFTRSAKEVLDKFGAKEVFTTGQDRAA